MHKKSKGGAHSHSTPIFASLEEVSKFLRNLLYPFRLYPAELVFCITHSEPSVFSELNNANCASLIQATVKVAVLVCAIHLLIEIKYSSISLFESDETFQSGLPLQNVITAIRLNVVDHDIPSPFVNVRVTLLASLYI